MIGYAFYTTEGVPLNMYGTVREGEGLVPFIDRYGIWVMYAPGIIGGRTVCYIGARFDNVKESILGRLNRVVLLMVFDDREKIRNAWRLFRKNAIQKLAEESGLIFEDEVQVSEKIERLYGGVPDEVCDEVCTSVYKFTRDYMKTLVNLGSLYDIEFRRIEVNGLTNLEYPSIPHRMQALKGILNAVYGVSKRSCTPEGFNNLLRGLGEDLVYPLIMYSKASGPNLGGLWFSRR